MCVFTNEHRFSEAVCNLFNALSELHSVEWSEKKILMNASESWNVACFGKVCIFFRLFFTCFCLVFYLVFPFRLKLQIDWITHVRRDQHYVIYQVMRKLCVYYVLYFSNCAQGQSLANDSFTACNCNFSCKQVLVRDIA